MHNFSMKAGCSKSDFLHNTKFCLLSCEPERGNRASLTRIGDCVLVDTLHNGQ